MNIVKTIYLSFSYLFSIMSTDTPICLAGESYLPLGKGYYDVIIFGLGFRECLLACLLLQEKKRVLNNYLNLL